MKEEKEKEMRDEIKKLVLLLLNNKLYLLHNDHFQLIFY